MDDAENEFEDLTNKLLEEEITMEHMKLALENVKSSVNRKFLENYENYTKTHSSIWVNLFLYYFSYFLILASCKSFYNKKIIIFDNN